ncbi:MAG TPA: DUF484 family protein [Gammaproteobacteria bacterium]|nr:DUF484 family protein [Gammaproteobacteria bacterium]
MTTQQEQKPSTAEPTPEQVEDYLRRHRDFLGRRPELLEELRVPHPVSGATSLIERQVSLLRERNRKLGQRLNELLDVARANEQLLERMHKLTLALLEAAGLDEALNAVQDTLRSEFDVDEVALLLYRDDARGEQRGPAQLLRPDDERLHVFAQVRENGRPRCGEPAAGQAEMLFGSCARKVASLALIPLGEGGYGGLLGAGSHRPDRFHPGMGTMFLARIGELIGAALAPLPD